MRIRTAQPKLRPTLGVAALLGFALTFASLPATAQRPAQAVDSGAARGLRAGRHAAVQPICPGRAARYRLHDALPPLSQRRLPCGCSRAREARNAADSVAAIRATARPPTRVRRRRDAIPAFRSRTHCRPMPGLASGHDGVRAADINIAARPSAGAQVELREDAMAKKQSDAVYKIVEVVGVSEKSWEDAGRNAVATAAGSLRDLRVAEVTRRWT